MALFESKVLQARGCFRTRYRTAFDSLFMLVCWKVWKERNARIFDDKSKVVEHLVADIKEEVLIWRATGIFSCEE